MRESEVEPWREYRVGECWGVKGRGKEAHIHLWRKSRVQRVLYQHQAAAFSSSVFVSGGKMKTKRFLDPKDGKS